MIKSFRYFTYDCKSYGLPKMYRSCIGRNYVIILHRCESKSSGFFYRMQSHYFAYPFPCTISRNHIRSIGNMRSKIRPVSPDDIGTDDLLIDRSHISKCIRITPVSQHLLSIRIRIENIRLSGCNDGLDDFPDIIII